VSVESLRQSLAESGFAVEVEARDRLAVIRPPNDEAARAIAAARERVSSIALRHGFSHVALEIVPGDRQRSAPPADAPLPGD
jgi:hypothetical protein